MVKGRPLAVPQLGSCASSGRAWRLWAAWHSQGEAWSLGSQPLPRVLELAASTAADITALDHVGGAHGRLGGDGCGGRGGRGGGELVIVDSSCSRACLMNSEYAGIISSDLFERPVAARFSIISLISIYLRICSLSPLQLSRVSSDRALTLAAAMRARESSGLLARLRSSDAAAAHAHKYTGFVMAGERVGQVRRRRRRPPPPPRSLVAASLLSATSLRARFAA